MLRYSIKTSVFFIIKLQSEPRNVHSTYILFAYDNYTDQKSTQLVSPYAVYKGPTLLTEQQPLKLCWTELPRNHQKRACFSAADIMNFSRFFSMNITERGNCRQSVNSKFVNKMKQEAVTVNYDG